MPGQSNTSESEKKAKDGVLNEPSNTKKPPNIKETNNIVEQEKNQEDSNKSESLKEYIFESRTPNNSNPFSSEIVTQDINIESRELYQINNFIR